MIELHCKPAAGRDQKQEEEEEAVGGSDLSAREPVTGAALLSLLSLVMVGMVGLVKRTDL